MFTLPHNTIAVLYKHPMDMRLGMFRLQSLISVYKEHSLTKGAFYLFINRPGTLLKAVRFDGTGICLFSKRLEKGQFSWPIQAIPNEVKANPAAYERLPESAKRVCRRVEIVPAHPSLHIYHCPVFVRKGKRGRKKQKAPIRAAASSTILPGSSIGNSIIARLLHGKYELTLPLYRQIREFERLGIHNRSEAMPCNRVRAAANTMEPIWKSMHCDLFAAPVLHVDEPPIRRLKSDKTNGYMRGMNRASDGKSLYYWADTRRASVPGVYAAQRCQVYQERQCPGEPSPEPQRRLQRPVP